MRSIPYNDWAKPPGEAEQKRCANAESNVRTAIQKSAELKQRRITVFTHGSYRNRVNVRDNSDVDVGVLCHDTFFYNLPEGTSSQTFNISPATYQYEQFKNEVEKALVDYFGRNAVKRGKKAFDIKETSRQVEADVAAFFEHRRYQSHGGHWSGVELRTDDGKRIINWPEQHYQNGVNKNSQTNQSFKGMVRILKRLMFQMEEKGLVSSEKVPGFLLECMTYNVPNEYFKHPDWSGDVRAVLAFLFNNTINDDGCNAWKEVSKMKWLFRIAQKWNRADAHAFLHAAWNYIGFQ
jgi:hypothetical protein